MRIEDGCNFPSKFTRSSEAFFMVERVNCQRLAGRLASNQIVKVSIGIICPDLFDKHLTVPPSSTISFSCVAGRIGDVFYLFQRVPSNPISLTEAFDIDAGIGFERV